ncbi:hypothetical protein HDV05_001270 [Chytridiales sp. JEL 0842]|nr:hypothetical protein HDV05_001270 [Chytridiales sp. JEL 0842]
MSTEAADNTDPPLFFIDTKGAPPPLDAYGAHAEDGPVSKSEIYQGGGGAGGDSLHGQHQRTASPQLTPSSSASSGKKNRQQQQNQQTSRSAKGKGKGKYKGPRTPNYGVGDDFLSLDSQTATGGSPKKSSRRGGRGRRNQRPQLSEDELNEEEMAIMKDYLDNASDGDVNSISALASLNLGSESIGGLKDVVLDTDEDSSSASEADESFIKKLERLPETGRYEDLAALFEFGSSSDSSLSDSSNVNGGAADSDDDDDDDLDDDSNRKGLFEGGRSSWQKETVSPGTTRKEKIIDSVLNGSFQSSSLSSSLKRDTQGEYEDEVVLPMSKSALRKARVRQQKSDRRMKREERQELKAQQARIANRMSKKRPGDAVDAEITRILDQMNKALKKFAEDSEDGLEVAPLPPMPSALRRLVKEMATHYRILPKLHGSGSYKTLYMVRTGATRIPDGWKNVVNIVVSRDQGILKGNTFSGKRSDKKRKKPPGAPDTRGMPKVGEVVGEGAKPIGEENLGYKMMLALGWSAGKVLGADQASERALVDPLDVTIRAKRRGLGAD